MTVTLNLCRAISHSLSAILFSILLVSLSACHHDEPDFGTKRIAGLYEAIPYEAIGTGKLGFYREADFFVIDADAKTSWGLSHTYGADLSPDGNYVAYNPQIYTKHEQIHVYNVNTGIVTVLSDQWSDFTKPAWTADSQTLIFTLDAAERVLCQQPLNRKGRTSIKMLAFDEEIPDPVCASVHGILAFGYMKVGFSPTWGIHTMKLDGTELTQLTPRTTVRPVWSPGGDKIAYPDFKVNSNSSNRQQDIMLMNADGSDTTAIASFQVPGFQRSAVSIAWSPDGKKIAFNLYEGYGTHIYVINIDGSGMTKITSKLEGDEYGISWSR